MQVGSATPSVAPSASSASSTSATGFSTGLPTPTGSATAARRSRFGGYSSRSRENLAALDVPAGDIMAGQVNRDKRFSLFNSCKLPALRCAALCCAVLCCAAGHDLHDGADDDVHDLCRQFQLHYQQHLIDSCLHSTQTGTGVDPLMLGGSKFHAVPAIALVVEAIRLHYCCVCSADTRQQGRDSR